MINAKDIFKISDPNEFKEIALAIFRHQFEHNVVYRSFCDLLLKHPSDVKDIEQIPFLPIQFFKSHKVICRNKTAEKIFYSSGTTATGRSMHHVADIILYEKSFRLGFKKHYGNIKDYVILALLPSYLQQENSSLIYMVNDLIKQSNHPESGFYLDGMSQLATTLQQLENKSQKTLLLGVSYALLDLIEDHSLKLNHTIVMETGGMKGRRREMIRDELHAALKKGFSTKSIHSEYGMTELLSQAYSNGDGIFTCPPWMKVFNRSVQDPLTVLRDFQTGGINIIDLANINSCSFIATQDLGKVYPDGSFEILGRFDSADIRGCNLLVM